MGAMDDACTKLLQQVNGSIMCAIVDLDSGVMLAMQPGGPGSRALGPVVIEAAIKLVRGAVIGRLVSSLRLHEAGPDAPVGYLEEAQLTTLEHCLFCRTVRGGRVLTLLVTTREVSVGMGWAQLKALLPEFEAATY